MLFGVVLMLVTIALILSATLSRKWLSFAVNTKTVVYTDTFDTNYHQHNVVVDVGLWKLDLCNKTTVTSDLPGKLSENEVCDTRDTVDMLNIFDDLNIKKRHRGETRGSAVLLNKRALFVCPFARIHMLSSFYKINKSIHTCLTDQRGAYK